MSIDFANAEYGRTRIIARGHSRHGSQREVSLWHVRFTELEVFSQKYQLSPYRKARLALWLNNVRSYYNLMGAGDKFPSDTAVAEWIDEIELSIGRIATAVSLSDVDIADGDKMFADGQVFIEAVTAMESVSTKWAATAKDDELVRTCFAAWRD